MVDRVAEDDLREYAHPDSYLADEEDSKALKITPAAWCMNGSSSDTGHNSDNMLESLIVQKNLSNRDFHTIEYAKSQLLEGDTLVCIKFPKNDTPYHPSGFPLLTRHVVHYDKLIATGSKTIIETLNSRELQFKIQRRFGLVNKLPAGIKYVLDLTPPEEGDEAVALTVLLSCPIGVRKWHMSKQRCEVPSSLVGGEDEVTYERLMQQSTDRRNNNYSGKDAEEYCKIRHRTGIERLLQVIEGKHPRLDSAPKVWTLVMLAHYFGCANIVVDPILSWLTVEPNNRFIEILPEAALKIGIVLENEYITRAAFSVLVSEKALSLGSGNFYREHTPSKIATIMADNKLVTRLGRPLDDVDEDWTNIIQYAAEAFATRIHQQITDLLNEDAKWIRNLPEYQKILDFEQFLRDNAAITNDTATPNLLQSVENLHLGIRDFVRGRLFRCILDGPTTQRARQLHANRISENLLGEPDWYYNEIYNSMNDQEKSLTRHLWVNIHMSDWSMASKDNAIFDTAPIGSFEYQENLKIGTTYKVLYLSLEQIESIARAVNMDIHIATLYMDYNNGILPAEAYAPSPAVYDSNDNSAISSTNLEVTDPESSWNPYDNEDVPTSKLRALSISSPEANITLHEEQMARRTSVGSNINMNFEPMIQLKEALHPDEELARFMMNALSSNTPLPANTRLARGMFFDDDEISTTSTFISLTRIFAQISEYLHNMSSANLSKGRLNFSNHCDILLSLSEKEFDFLPLWAGGINDGSGGVFASEIPLADRGAPIEPGPSYHTGSTLNSAMGSDVDFDGESFSFVGGSGLSEGGHTSMGVENGYSDHLGRGVVASEDDFVMHEDAAEIDFVVTYKTLEDPAPTTSTQRSSFINDENFFNTPDEDEEDDDSEDWDIMDDDDDDDEGNATETED